MAKKIESADIGRAIEKQTPLEVELGKAFLPFAQEDFQNLDVEKIERRFRVEGVGRGAACYERFDPNRWTERVRIITPYGEVVTRYTALPGQEPRTIFPLYLEIWLERPQGHLYTCQIVFRTAGLLLEAHEARPKDPQTAFFEVESEVHQGHKSFAIYLPDNPNALADLSLRFERVK